MFSHTLREILGLIPKLDVEGSIPFVRSFLVFTERCLRYLPTGGSAAVSTRNTRMGKGNRAAKTANAEVPQACIRSSLLPSQRRVRAPRSLRFVLPSPSLVNLKDATRERLGSTDLINRVLMRNAACPSGLESDVLKADSINRTPHPMNRSISELQGYRIRVSS